MSKKITVNEIDKILDEALSDYKLGKIQYKNIVFIDDADSFTHRQQMDLYSLHSCMVFPARRA